MAVRLNLEYVLAMKAGHDELAPRIDTLIDLYNRKLWHQLNNELDTFILLPMFAAPGALVAFYNNFIKDFSTRLNRLRHAVIARRVSENFTDNAESRAFVVSVCDEVKDSAEAVLYLKTRLATLSMRDGDWKEAKETLRSVREDLDRLTNADVAVHSALAKAAMEYHRAQGTPSEFYKNALLFVHYTPAEWLTAVERENIAFELALAACVGDDIYNFGELLSHSTVSSLQSSQYSWIYALLVAFNEGSLAAYHSVISQNRHLLEQQPALVSKAHILEEKIRICAFLEILFQRPASSRMLSFTEVASATNCPIDQVELLLMRAMSLGLVKGVIDGVTHSVDITWLHPRVLQTPQLQILRDRLGTWAKTVDETIKYMETHATGLTAQ